MRHKSPAVKLTLKFEIFSVKFMYWCEQSTASTLNFTIIYIRQRFTQLVDVTFSYTFVYFFQKSTILVIICVITLLSPIHMFPCISPACFYRKYCTAWPPIMVIIIIISKSLSTRSLIATYRSGSLYYFTSEYLIIYL